MFDKLYKIYFYTYDKIEGEEKLDSNSNEYKMWKRIFLSEHDNNYSKAIEYLEKELLTII